MSQPLFITVVLDVPRRICYDGAAIFNMGSLDKPFSVTDMGKGNKAFAAIFTWAWACLYEPHPFDSPRDLCKLAYTFDAAKREAVTNAVIDAVKMGLPSKRKEDETKNESAEKSPTQESNSA